MENCIFVFEFLILFPFVGGRNIDKTKVVRGLVSLYFSTDKYGEYYIDYYREYYEVKFQG